jgi:hypothetical protein
MRGGSLSEKLPPSRRLVREASNWSEVRRLASDGLDRDPQSPLYRILAFEDHLWFEDRWMVASLCDE